MISFLRGQFVEKSPTWVWIDVNGVGYEVHISLHTYSSIQDKKEGLLYTILLVREDAHLLYGFAEKSERDLFQHLISVSGVGASTARVMLSYLKPEELRE
jgi:Holliday junction DNA helicase RuvA